MLEVTWSRDVLLIELPQRLRFPENSFIRLLPVKVDCLCPLLLVEEVLHTFQHAASFVLTVWTWEGGGVSSCMLRGKVDSLCKLHSMGFAVDGERVEVVLHCIVLAASLQARLPQSDAWQVRGRAGGRAKREEDYGNRGYTVPKDPPLDTNTVQPSFTPH